MRLEDRLYKVIRGMIREAMKSLVAFKLAKIPDDYVEGKPQLIFDGEDSPTVKRYSYLASYSPAAGDPVLVALVGTSGVVLGKVIR